MAASFGAALRDARTRSGLTQAELGRRTGVSVRAIRDIEHGRVRPRHASARRLAEAVGLEPPPARKQVRIEVLGPLRLSVAGRRVLPGSLKQRSLLGLLALQPGVAVGYDQIIDVLWGEHASDSSHHLVHTYVSRLRRLMDPDRSGPSSAKLIVGVRGGYRLAAEHVDLDLVRFDDLVARAAQAEGGEALDLLSEALSYWKGRPLADLPGPLGRHPAAVAAKERWLAAVVSHAELAMELGAYERAVESLSAAVAEEPLHEGLHADLMLALAGCGRQAAALAVFDEIRGRLVGDLGVEPGTLLRDAQARVLRPAALRRGGTPAWWRPAQLPADVAGFAGRTKELAGLDGMVRAGAPVVVVTGMPGVGKTALALHWARREAGRFPDGQLYVNLRGHDQRSPLSPLQALAGMLAALGVSAEGVPADLDEAAALYRTLLDDRRLLVLLDNAHSAQQVRPLLPGGSSSLALVTSRDHLTGLVVTHGARRLVLDTLTPEESRALLAHILDRDVDGEAATRLAHACGRLPLALRIAAANLAGSPDLSISDYLDGLPPGDPLAGLSVDGDPQTGVKIAFDHSYRELPAPAARLFRLLAVAPGADLRTDAIASLAGIRVDQAERLLELLVGAHLVETRRPDRYGLHDLLRSYACERAGHEDSPEERDRALDRLMGWYVHTADAAARLLYPDKVRLPVGAPPCAPARLADEAQAVAWLESEWANLVSAVQHAAEHGSRSSAWLLADTLRGYFWIQWPAPGWDTAARSGLEAAVGAGDLRGQAACHLGLGDAHQAAEEYAEAVRHYVEALELADRAGWSDGTAEILFELGLARWWLGVPGEAIGLLTDALTLFRQSGRQGGEAAALLHLGVVERHLGRLRSAAAHQAHALAVYRRLGSRLGEAQALGNLGITYQELSRLNPAVDRLEAALGRLGTNENRFGRACFLSTLAAAHRDACRYDEAMTAAAAAHDLARDLGHRLLEADACTTLAAVHQARGERRTAHDLYARGLELTLGTSFSAPRVVAWLGLASLHQDAGRPAEALAQAGRAREVAAKDGFQLLVGRALAAMALAHHGLGEGEQAHEHADRALSVYRLTGHALGEAQMLSLMGALAREREGAAYAVPYWRAAFSLFKGIGRPEADELRAVLHTHA
ncbi:BTAD domain-containing putative transcriptional regulator [Nonomuraea sp. SYSU D8015]|uniref:BTAD domain-containing putative transcriptional regulator n=1 Tax=Nonomuraea sp. SYSU D8015 TaxID=2593644 RepID=UPI0016604D4E|nr:BTAD domain-containing putative transcriptional regulator [Nonomuraea sp. SYSU D8015]